MPDEKSGIDKDKINFNRFSTEELDNLKLFKQRFSEMNESRIIKERALGYKIQITGERGKPVKESGKFSDEDDLRSLLVLLRPILMANEPIYIEKIVYLLISRSNNDECADYFRTLYVNYQREISKTTIQIKVNEKTYTNKEIFSVWLNGHYFHLDPSKRKILEALKRIAPFSRGVFYDHLILIFEYLELINHIICNRILHDS